MSFPSGDTAGLRSTVAFAVSCRLPLPSGFAIHMSVDVESLAGKTIDPSRANVTSNWAAEKGWIAEGFVASPTPSADSNTVSRAMIFERSADAPRRDSELELKVT